MIGGDSKFVLTCTHACVPAHTHMFPHTHTRHTHFRTKDSPNRGRDHGNKYDVLVVDFSLVSTTLWVDGQSTTRNSTDVVTSFGYVSASIMRETTPDGLTLFPVNPTRGISIGLNRSLSIFIC